MLLPFTSVKRLHKHRYDTQHMPSLPNASQTNKHDTMHEKARHNGQFETGEAQRCHCGLKTCANKIYTCDFGVTTQL